jgi:hypothetical protein
LAGRVPGKSAEHIEESGADAGEGRSEEYSHGLSRSWNVLVSQAEVSRTGLGGGFWLDSVEKLRGRILLENAKPLESLKF